MSKSIQDYVSDMSDRYRFRLIFQSEVLATCAANDRLFEDYINSKVEDPEVRKREMERIRSSIEAQQELLEKLGKGGTTIFITNTKGQKCLRGYMIKGFLKAAGNALRVKQNANAEPVPAASEDEEEEGKEQNKNRKPAKKAGKGSKWGSISGKIDVFCNVFGVNPGTDKLDWDYIPLQNAANITSLQRPIRVITMQGPRVSLVRSEAAPIDSFIEVEIRLMKGGAVTADMLYEMLAYGATYGGIGQWRNAGYGRFWTEELAAK
jgi:hypothetical protein